MRRISLKVKAESSKGRRMKTGFQFVIANEEKSLKVKAESSK
jgi:hypothetical protein